MNLDLIHINGVRADCCRHVNTLSLCSGCIGRHERFIFGLVPGNHLGVRAEAAGSNDNRLCVDRNLFTGRSFGFHADCLSVLVRQNLVRCRLGQHRDTALVYIFLENRYNIASDRNNLAVFIQRSVNTHNRSAACLSDRRK